MTNGERNVEGELENYLQELYSCRDCRLPQIEWSDAAGCAVVLKGLTPG